MSFSRARFEGLGLSVCVLALLPLPARAQGQHFEATPQLLPQQPYRALTNTKRSFTNLNVEVVRGLAVTPDGADLFAINSYESTVVHFQNLTGAPVSRWHTLNNPSSIAFYQNDLLVVGQGNHALARHDRTTGLITDVLMLRAEPSDIAVDDDNHWAWVSCMGDDAVVQVDLNTPMSIIKVWNTNDGLNVKRPRFLYLDLSAPGGSDNQLYVAPMVSGNNTLITIRFAAIPPATTNPLNDVVLDGNDATLFPGGGLPDVDLFRIRTGTTPAVDAVLKKAGSLLLAHGRNPFTNDYWMLNLRENNVVPGMLTEPSVRGKFADNMLAITSAANFPAPGAPAVQPDTFIDIDDNTPDTPEPTYSVATAVAFPYSIEFHTNGWAAIGSSGSPVIQVMDKNGRRRQTLVLDNASLSISGRVVRSIKLVGSNLIAYCQQTNNVLVWNVTPVTPIPIRALSLGNDPTPQPVKAGRATWYDATPSLNGKTSCNSCHPQGGADSLVWQISNQPVDEKGPMVTQPILGLEDSFPYHWRGERELADFNGAFPGLLGTAAPLDENNGELARFLEFMFSLAPPANPNQDTDRLLKDTLTPNPQGKGLVPMPLVGSPIRGDTIFHEVDADGLFMNGSCASCHLDPTGSNGDFFADKPDQVATKSNIEIIQLDTHLTLKNQPLVDVAVNPLLAGTSSIKSQLLGSGILHDGRVVSLFELVDRFFPGLGDQQASDTTAFLSVFDSGTAPGVHGVTRLDASTSAAKAKRMKNRIADQTSKGWIGVVVLGTFPIAGVPTPMTWYYDPASALYIPENTSLVGPQPFSAFKQAAAAGLADDVFIGVPPGNERRLGADFDNDGLDTGQEIAHGTSPWNPDSDGDTWPDGYEVANGSNPALASSVPNDTTPPALVGPITIDFVNASQIKLHFKSNEPATWSIRLSTPSGQTITNSRLTFDTIHTAVVHKLEPSTADFKTNTFTGGLTLTDLSGRASPAIPLPIFDTASMVHQNTVAGVGLNVVIGSLGLTQELRVGSTYSARANVRVDWREQGPPAFAAPDHVLIAQILKQDPNGKDWLIVPASELTHNAPNTPSTSFLWGGVPYNALSGPFLVLTPTTQSGTANVSFTVTNLAPNQKIMFNVLTAVPIPAGYDPMNPAFPGGNQRRYQMPATPKDLRGVTSTQ